MMSEKAKSSKRKERGLNVRVTQAKKTTERDEVHVNSYSSKKKTTAKESVKKKATTSKKKTTTKKTTTKKTTTKKPVEKKLVEVKKVEKVEKVKKVEKVEPVKVEEPKVEVKTEEPKAEIKPEEPKVELKIEEPKVEPVKVEVKPASFSKSVKALDEKEPEVILPEETEVEKAETEKVGAEKVEAEKTDGFETLSLNTTETYTSKIIPRDVTRNREEIEHPKTLVSTFEPEKIEESEKVAAPVFRKQVAQPKKMSAKEIKEQEIKKAVNSASRLPQTGKKRASRGFGNLGWARLTLIITCVTTAVFALVYFINLASSDVSLKVAAAQSGIDATYPNYVPRGYELSDVTSASGKVSMTFKSEDGSFMISEEATNWDSNALLYNYIRENYDEGSYSVVSEQGLTIYMGVNWEAWVNGGLLYKLNVKTGSLTKKQLKTIATSL